MAGREKRRTESMKTISGKLTSAPTPLSLSKATRVISAFVAADSTASQPLYAYLKRAAAAFTELNQLHRELKSSSSSTSHHGRRKKSQSQLKLEEGDSKGEVVLNGGEIESVDKKRNDLIENKTIEEEEVKEVDKQKEEVGNGEKSKKKAKSTAGDEVVIKEVEEVAKEIVCGKKRKKKGKVSTEEEEVKKEQFLSEETGKKKRAQAVKEAEEVRIEENEAKKEEETRKEVEAEEKRKKKRKSIKVEKELNDSEEMPKSKKKRRKME